MKFVLFVEGQTERQGLPRFLKRWLDPQLSKQIGIKVVQFQGVSSYYDEIEGKVDLNLSEEPGTDIIAAIGLLDLYGLPFCPKNKKTTGARYAWAKDHLERRVENPRFHQHFAVHETEAWLLSHPDILPPAVQKALPGKAAWPETINLHEPPGNSWLDSIKRSWVCGIKKWLTEPTSSSRSHPTGLTRSAPISRNFSTTC